MRGEKKTIQEIAKLLKKEFKPAQLYLFGSRATGMAKKDSDFDFVMVVPNFKGDRMKMWERCNDLIQDRLDVLADVFVYSKKEFQEAKNDFNSIPETAVSAGQEIDLGNL